MNLEKIVSGAGYTTLTATNGQQAVEMSKAQLPDVILMDVNMDQMDGFAATRAIGGDASTKGIPVVLVTSKSQKADRVWAQMLGVKGYVTLTATNGQQAVEMSQAQMPDVILMDVNMDQMDGFAATRAIGGDASTKSIPVVLVTSKNQKADRVWAQMLGVKGYVTKPYTPDQILGAIAACA